MNYRSRLLKLWNNVANLQPLFKALLTRWPTVDVVGKPSRDLRIDVVRGLMLVFIFINHMPGNFIARYTLSNFSFSDAAEIFVLLAGLSATLAYGKIIDQQGLAVGMLRLGARLWTLYVAHLIVFLIVCGVVFMAVTRTQNPLYIALINIQPFLSDPLNALVDVLTLVYQPSYLNILPLYIVLLAAFPCIYLLVRRSPALALVVSVMVWQGATFFNINLPERFGGWFFNPLGWQLVFTLGVVMGQFMRHGISLGNPRAVTTIALAVLIILCLVKIYPPGFLGLPWLEAWIDEVHIGNNKMNLAPVRVAHLLAIIWVFCAFVSARTPLLTTIAGRILAMMGRHSLAVFCTGSVLSILGEVIMTETSYVITIQLLVCATGITLLAGLGAFLSWYQLQVGSQTARQPAPSGSALPSRS
ncbi:OpgC family protein [Azomonas macrocytogenes]|uniref:OpgC protein n=1 Tax=Azomonas macrocytogenes TaxID=69962 RepID=A0A839T9J9_AZOMA|nr:OpgC domain-containing protein [Azomonas macrocytogenes]MBB3104884.1 hypothetical protein [Azomonas macrocytogenes]